MSEFPYFTFNGERSTKYGLYITDKNVFDSPSRDVTYESIPGRNGDLIIDNGRYNNISIKYKTAIVAPKEKLWDFHSTIRRIKSWLFENQGYFVLFDSYDPDFFRYASCSDVLNFTQDTKVQDIGSVEITFNCKPFRYTFEGKKVVTVTSSDIIRNIEYFPSLPYIKIFGQGDVTLYVNNEAFNFKNIDEYIEIDSETMNAYKDSEPQNFKMASLEFPKFQHGDNSISWTGNVTKLEIIPRWCCL